MINPYGRSFRNQRSSFGRQRFRNNKKGKLARLVKRVLVLGVLAFLLWNVFGFLRNIGGDPAAVLLSLEKGNAELQLEGSTLWTPVFDGTKIYPGDKVRTNANTIVSAEFNDGNTLFLNERTEVALRENLEKKSSRKTDLELKNGELWGYVAENKSLESGDSHFKVQVKNVDFSITGNIFNILADKSETVVRVMQGAITANVKDPDSEKNVDLTIGVAQKLVINTTTIAAILKGNAQLIPNDELFLESTWHLENLAKFDPETATQIRRTLEIKLKKKEQEAQAKKALTEFSAPKVLSPKDGEQFAAGTQTVTIQGTTKGDTYQVTVNGYTLTQYSPGDKKWRYLASKKFGTLVAGENLFEVQAVKRTGEKSPITKLKIYYNAPKAVVNTQNLPPTVVKSVLNPKAVVSNFPNPEILTPKRTNQNETYYTSAPILNISGQVSAKTQMVTVNDYRLKKFTPGSTRFSYIANADFGSLKPGTNTFDVRAYGPNKESSSTVLTVIYKPVN